MFAPVPQESRVVRNARGKYGTTWRSVLRLQKEVILTAFEVYIGHSASLSFLHQIRRIVASAIGTCLFTEDVYLAADSYRHQMIEPMPVFSTPTSTRAPQIDVNRAIELTGYFSQATAGILHLFDHESLIGRIRQFVSSRDSDEGADCPVLYMVLALGAQARGLDSATDDLAESCFRFALCRAMTTLVDMPDVLTVQSFCMITWYALTACRRSVAAIYLGIAAQAAHTIGLHRSESNQVFHSEEKEYREKAWMSLRFCDVYMAASLGRPMTTSNVYRLGGSKFPLSADEENRQQNGDDFAPLSTSLSNIFERILSEIYTKQYVTLQLVESIAQQLRAWSSRLSDLVEADNSSNEDGKISLLKSSNLSIAYHYSIVLLTCPFLTLRITTELKGKALLQEEDMQSAGLITFSDACVTSAIESISAAKTLIQRQPLFKRLPLMINSVFMSALCLGLACFGSDDHLRTHLDDSLKQAAAVLACFERCNPQAARYVRIVDQLNQAATAYRGNRDQIALQKSSQRFKNLFGHISAHAAVPDRTTTLPDNLQCSRYGSSERELSETDLNVTSGLDDPGISFLTFDCCREPLDDMSSGTYLATCEVPLESDAFLALDVNGASTIFRDGQSLMVLSPAMDDSPASDSLVIGVS